MHQIARSSCRRRRVRLGPVSTDATWIVKFDGPHRGVRVAIKDLLDLAGQPTTAGCVAVARMAAPALTDARCLIGLRAAVARGEASIVGKTNLHELAFGADGINPAFGTPRNPLDEAVIPGGSSSGSAVAVANNEADVGIGSDTGGSIRIPAACCGIVGLKTTWGRIPVEGCWPLAPFLDTIGPLARTVAETVAAMDLLEPGFAAEVAGASAKLHRRVGRIVGHWIDVDPVVSASVDALLDRMRAEHGIEIVDVKLPGWAEAHAAGLTILLAEAWRSNSHLLAGEGVSTEVTERLHLGQSITDAALTKARGQRAIIVAELRTLMTVRRLDALAIPTMPTLPPRMSIANASLTALTRLANIAGVPALSIPAPVPSQLRQPETAKLVSSLQLVGLPGADATLCALTMLLE